MATLAEYMQALYAEHHRLDEDDDTADKRYPSYPAFIDRRHRFGVDGDIAAGTADGGNHRAAPAYHDAFDDRLAAVIELLLFRHIRLNKKESR